MLTYGLDPGRDRSALVAIDEDSRIAYTLLSHNDAVALQLQQIRLQDVVWCEMVRSFGNVVGNDIFRTVFWTGKFSTLCLCPFRETYRKQVVTHHTGDSRAGDKEVRAAMIERFGAEATKGIKADLWSALAVAAYGWDVHRSEKGPGVA